MLDAIEQIGAFAGLAAFLGLAVLALLSFSQARDLRRLREWAGSAPERDSERKEATSAVAAQRAEELRQLEESRTAEREAVSSREERRRRREAGLPEGGRGERIGGWFSDLGERVAEPRYLVALFVVMLVVVGGGAFLLLGGSDDGSSANGARGGGGGGGNAKQANTAPQVQPSEIEVAALNGTSTSGLAAEVGDEVEREGFMLGEVTNTPTSFTESVVMFRPGHAPEARQVSKALGIPSVQMISADVDGVSGGADVAVVVGEDNASAAG